MRKRIRWLELGIVVGACVVLIALGIAIGRKRAAAACSSPSRRATRRFTAGEPGTGGE
jgi:hypothetical protein